MTTPTPFLSIIIKTLNEEHKIAGTIESALAVENEIGKPVEIVVADSVSGDRTTAIAGTYPIRVVQFKNANERGCGAGLQLGYEWSRGEFVYFLDGDMTIMPGFIPRALGELAAHPELAGVGGLVEDTRIGNDVDRIRTNNRAVSMAGDAKWLEGGGLYRRQAIESAGNYAADRNLRGYEEAELGMRLRHAGWRLIRLPAKAVAHTGHDIGTWELFRRHWRTRRAMSGGVLLRSALGKRWLPDTLRMLIHPLVTLSWWLVFVPALLFAASRHDLAFALLFGLPMFAFIGLALRKRDLRHVLVSAFSWHYGAVAILLGCFEKRVPPSTPITAIKLHDGVLGEAGDLN